MCCGNISLITGLLVPRGVWMRLAQMVLAQGHITRVSYGLKYLACLLGRWKEEKP
jgi:hypothetical protein